MLVSGPLLAAPARAERRLEWTALAVRARLDADGRLHVRERQTILFDGDWNGGERTFRLRGAQTIELHELRRFDHGVASILTRGSLDRVDNYDWVRPGVLRWRARSPADAPFDHTEIAYLLDYTLSNVLRSRPGGYLLDHDFAFPDRPGPIHRFMLDVDIDPAWVPGAPVPRDIDTGPLAPGQSYVVSLPLAYVGTGVPAAVDRRGPRLRRFTVAALLVLPPLLAAAVLLRERRIGRLGRLPAVDRAWLDQNVFPHPPELIGAAWDEAVGPPEVAATLARMVGEGKLRSAVDEGRDADLHLEFLADRQRLDGYERKLVDGLFFDGPATSTAAVKAHYHDKGFSPAAILRPWLEPDARRLVGEGRVAHRTASALSWSLFVLGAALLAGQGWPAVDLHRALLFMAGFTLVFFGVIIRLAADTWRRRLDWGGGASVLFLAPAMGLVAAAIPFVVLTEDAALPAESAAGVAALALAVLSGSLNAARCRQDAAGLAFRKRLVAARRYFARQLERPAPNLEDAWFPYLIAFGLDENVQRWFRAFPAASSGSSMTSTSSSTPSTSSGGSAPGRSWTGGGGSFGGAGASAGWAAAASGMAAGVAAPSSGSGGGGGGSSGGGGGGGW